MVPEVLLALLGVPGEVIVLAPATDDAPERLRVAPDLPFLDAPERACLDRLVAQLRTAAPVGEGAEC